MQDQTAKDSESLSKIDRGFLLVAVLFLLPAVPLCFLGYGSDLDTYLELDAGVSTWRDGAPVMSRHPGYWLHEALVYFVDRLGGPVLINLTTLVAGLLLLQRFWGMCGSLGIEWRVPLTLSLAWNPWFLIASTSAIDYVWAALFVLLAVEAFLNGRLVVSGLLAGIAVAFRLGSAFPIAGAVSWWVVRNWSMVSLRRGAVVGVVLVAISMLFYYPSWITAGRSLAFLTGHVGDAELWSLKAHLGRIVYKPLYLLGMAANAVVLLMLVLNRSRLVPVLRDKRRLVVLSIGAAIGTLILYAMYPIEHSYLLPALPFMLLLLGLLLNGAPPWQPWLLVAATLSYWLVSFPLATPDRAGAASSATVDMRIEKGAIVEDIQDRIHLMGCISFECYKLRRR